MGVSAAIFESAGKRTEHYVPGVYSRSNNVTSPSGVSAGNLCILGSSAGGKPWSLLEFGSVADAQTVLGSGELLNAVAYAFNGSNDYVPQRVFAMRVNDGTQASLTLQNGGTDVLTLKAWDWSAMTNQLRMKIEAGTAANSKKVTVAYKDDVVVVDNIVKPSLQILGTCTNPTVTVTNTGITLAGEDDDSQPVSETINFESFPTINEIVERINDTDYFTATAIDADESALGANLDALTATDISTAVTLYSNALAFKKAVEGIEYIGSAEFVGTTKVVPENITFTYFTGGASASANITGWRTALANLEVEDIQIIATPSTDSDAQTLIANHCTTMSSTVNRKERTCILGAALNETDDDAIAKAVGFNNKLVTYVVDTVTTANPLSGAVESINGAMLGCALAGMESAMAVNQPLTNKTIKVLGFAKKRTIANMEKLIKAGVLVCNPSPDNMTNYVVIRALTTYQSDDLINNEMSMVREDLYMNRDLRNRFGSSIGQPNNIPTSSILATLNDAAKEWADAGYIVPSDNNENVWNKSVRVNGDKIYITYSRYLTAPTNFIFITATNHIYTSTVEV